MPFLIGKLKICRAVTFSSENRTGLALKYTPLHMQGFPPSSSRNFGYNNDVNRILFGWRDDAAKNG